MKIVIVSDIHSNFAALEALPEKNYDHLWWEDGNISLKEYKYPLSETIRGIRTMPIASEDQDALITVLETGGQLPAQGPVKPVGALL